MNNSSAPCSLPDVETHAQIPVPLSLLGGLDTIERQPSLMLNLISALRPALAAFSGCKLPDEFPHLLLFACSSFHSLCPRRLHKITPYFTTLAERNKT